MYFAILDRVKNSPVIFVLLALLFVVAANFLATIDISLIVYLMAGLVAIVLVVMIYFNPIYAVVLHFVCSFLMFFMFYRVLKMTSIPLGFVYEGLNVLPLVVLLMKRQLTGWQTTFGVLLLIWLGLCTIELFNPFAASRVAWVQAIRQVVNTVVPFFVLYSLARKEEKVIKLLLNTWVFLCTLAALYTIYQELVGLPSWDYNFIHADENKKNLYYTFGRLRKLSFFASPTENGIVLCINFVVCLALGYRPNINRFKRYSFILLGMVSLWAMVYTGTRTATVLFVIGAGCYAILRWSKELNVLIGIGAFLIMGYIIATGGGQAIYVMTTAFNTEEDPSMQVRYNNQSMLRGYLYKSPFGYGMGSTGFVGMKYSPHTFLGSFPPDSELVRIVVEVGPIGLMYYLFMFYMFIKRSAISLLEGSDQTVQNIKYLMVSLLVLILIGNYPQEIHTYPSVRLLFAMLLAVACLTPEEINRAFNGSK